ncbi:hypothetical protein [Herbidospora mongoliensis]|uniref:hypothetical protein n=1 Tax=Herbidospora mongoliensis TaxID=688067 RepID=UPI0012F898DA|nr:hypothetical protein [Herbidospora mongoliensis]
MRMEATGGPYRHKGVRRKKGRAAEILAAAANGELDCLGFALAVEKLEDESEVVVAEVRGFGLEVTREEFAAAGEIMTGLKRELA